MNLYISTGLLSSKERHNIFKLLSNWRHINLGVEILSHFEMDSYSRILDNCVNFLKEVPVSFHGNYAQTEHSAKKGSKEYELAMDYFKQTLEYANKLNSNYFVFHHNNCQIISNQREEMIYYSTENLIEMTVLAEKSGLNILVENAGIKQNMTMLYDEKKFIDLFNNIQNGCLIDVGHSNCNDWDIENVISSLKSRIECYHLHNNCDNFDYHNRILDGTFDMDKFFDFYNMYTPTSNLVIEYIPELLHHYEDVEDDIKYILSKIKN